MCSKYRLVQIKYGIVLRMKCFFSQIFCSISQSGAQKRLSSLKFYLLRFPGRFAKHTIDTPFSDAENYIKKKLQ